MTQTGSGHHCVVVADDDPMLRRLIRLTLSPGDYDVLEADDGESAFALARETRPRVVLLDVNMPGTDGFQVCRGLREDPATRDIPVVLLTARATPADRAEGQRVGASAYLTKPFSPRELLDLIDELAA